MQGLTLNVGDVIASKYRVERELARGGMATIVEATQLELDRPVAIKLLTYAGEQPAATRARFEREGRIAASLRSDHVVRVLDVGYLETGKPFIVMEFLHGCDFSAVLKRGGPVPAQEAVRYLLQASEAMAEAHSAGIVHRDLKPANLFLAERPDGTSMLKVLDFGISKVLEPQEEQLIQTQGMLGSPQYMSPEQLGSSCDTTYETDIWALGVILYELLAGKPPFAGPAVEELYASILFADPVPLPELRADVPEGLWQVVQRCLYKAPQERYRSAAELAAALAPFAPDAAASAATAARLPSPAPLPSDGNLEDDTPQHARRVNSDGDVPTVVEGRAKEAADEGAAGSRSSTSAGSLWAIATSARARGLRRFDQVSSWGRVGLIACAGLLAAAAAYQGAQPEPVSPDSAEFTEAAVVDSLAAARPAQPVPNHPVPRKSEQVSAQKTAPRATEPVTPPARERTRSSVASEPKSRGMPRKQQSAEPTRVDDLLRYR